MLCEVYDTLIRFAERVLKLGTVDERILVLGVPAIASAAAFSVKAKREREAEIADLKAKLIQALTDQQWTHEQIAKLSS